MRISINSVGKPVGKIEQTYHADRVELLRYLQEYDEKKSCDITTELLKIFIYADHHL